MAGCCARRRHVHVLSQDPLLLLLLMMLNTEYFDVVEIIFDCDGRESSPIKLSHNTRINVVIG